MDMPPSKSKVATVLRVTSGNFLEMFDFFLFGFYATYISRAFFPAGSEFASLMLTFMTFGAGFLMRPLGAIILGRLCGQDRPPQGADRHAHHHGDGHDPDRLRPGRRDDRPVRAVPGADRAAAAGLLRRRRARRRVGVSRRDGNARQQGLLCLLAVRQPASRDHGRGLDRLSCLNQAISPQAMSDWGWRVPFFIGCMIVPFLFYIRRSLEETEEFQRRKHHPTMNEVFCLACPKLADRDSRHAVGRHDHDRVLHNHRVHADLRQEACSSFPTRDSLLVTFCVGLSNFHLAAGDGRAFRPRSGASRSCSPFPDLH